VFPVRAANRAFLPVLWRDPYWADILRVAASIRTGTVTASAIMRQLASYPRQNGVAAALRELGRMERTVFTLDWIED